MCPLHWAESVHVRLATSLVENVHLVWSPTMATRRETMTAIATVAALIATVGYDEIDTKAGKGNISLPEFLGATPNHATYTRV